MAFDQTELRRRRQRDRTTTHPHLSKFPLNSAIELVLDERSEFDVLDNEHVRIDFTPLFECLHIYDALGERDVFRRIYSDTRMQQKELLMNQYTSLEFRKEGETDDISALAALLEQIAGFAILEKATVRKTREFRSEAEVEGLWEGMVKRAVAVMTPAELVKLCLAIKHTLAEIAVKKLSGADTKALMREKIAPLLFAASKCRPGRKKCASWSAMRRRRIGRITKRW